MVYEFSIRTFEPQEFIDITTYVYRALETSGVESGVCLVFVPHTTAAVTINENADPDVVEDILGELNMLVPAHDGYAHIEGNSAAHIKSSMMGVSLQVVIHEGELLMGRWQGIYLAEFDGPRTRTVYVKVQPDPEHFKTINLEAIEMSDDENENQNSDET